MLNYSRKLITTAALSMLTISAYAVNPLHLTSTSVANFNKQFLLNKTSDVSILEIARKMDEQQILHISLQQIYKGYPVLHGNAVLHVPNANKDDALTSLAQSPQAFLTGVFYEKFDADFKENPPHSLTEKQKERLLTALIDDLAKNKLRAFKDNIVLYVDKSKKAHWAYTIDLQMEADKKLYKVNAIVNANDLSVYDRNEISRPVLSDLKLKTMASSRYEMVLAGGIGGNEKTGRVYYDGLDAPNHKSPFLVSRDPITKICYLKDQDIYVKDMKRNFDTVSFPCAEKDPTHNDVYWNNNLDESNGAFNPANDVYYAAQKTRDMFEAEYNQALWQDHGVKKKLNFFIHADKTEYWNGAWFSEPDLNWYVSISDGDDELYPRVALDTIGNLIGAGYKESVSFYAWGSGSMVGTCYAFRNFFGKAVEYATTKSNVWNLGAEVMKAPNKAIIYFDHPSRDCNGRKPGDECSIENVNDISDLLTLHGFYTAGVLDKAFYLLAHSSGWDTQKVFRTMIQANLYYWTADWERHYPEEEFTFNDAACGMLYAAKDYHYDTEPLAFAFLQVGIDVNQCAIRK